MSSGNGDGYGEVRFDAASIKIELASYQHSRPSTRLVHASFWTPLPLLICFLKVLPTHFKIKEEISISRRNLR